MTDQPSSFYRLDDDTPLQQGDVLLAPLVRVVPAGAPPDTGPGRLFEQAKAVVPPPDADLGEAEVRVGWGPVVLTSHDCHLEKEFQRRYRQLRRAGRSKADAIAAAEEDPSLDRWLMVAPIHDPFIDVAPGDRAAQQAAEAAANGEVIGLCPIPPFAERGISGGVADLTWLSTIDRTTVVARLASMSEEGRSRLRTALARSSALRTPELGFILEDIIGDRIDDARRSSADPLVVELELRRSGTVRLLAQPGEPATGGPERTRASAPHAGAAPMARSAERRRR